MIQYERILNKIAPVFHKFLNYETYFDEFLEFIDSYLESANIPTGIGNFIIPKSAGYVFLVKYLYSIPTHDIPRLDVSVILSPTYKLVPKFYPSQITCKMGAEIIVNLIINRFNFENEKIIEYALFSKIPRIVDASLDFKKYITVLVGKDTYETIKNNIK
jgi:hypothetical protein